MTTSASPRSTAAITVRVLLFASYADLAGRATLELAVPRGATVRDVVQAVRQALPDGNRLPERPLAAVDRVHARPDTVVADGAEVALLPPLAGG
jgi:MoaE-MoaD fusion protein